MSRAMERAARQAGVMWRSEKAARRLRMLAIFASLITLWSIFMHTNPFILSGACATGWVLAEVTVRGAIWVSERRRDRTRR